MQPEQMALILRATNDAKAALTSVLAIWDHYGVGSDTERFRMRTMVSTFSRELSALNRSLDAALKIKS